MTMTKDEYRKDFQALGGDEALDIARSVLSLLADYTREYEPYAVNSIRTIDNAHGEIPSTLDELLEETE